MKKSVYISIVALFISNFAWSQNEGDALRYSQLYPSGTARFSAMGGAFGALGGDFSSLSINPAGLGVYRSSELTFTPSLSFTNSSAKYYGSTNEDTKYNLNINNMGFLAAFSAKNKEGDGWKSGGFAMGYNRLSNFNKSIAIEGINNESSMAGYFASNANGTNFNNLDLFQENLAWQTYLIDTLGGSTKYVGAMSSNATKTQRKSTTTSGGIGEFVFSLGGNYNNKLYLGATIGIQTVNYEESSIYSEILPISPSNDLNSFTYNNYLKTKGTGFNLKLGAIFRPVDWTRIGLAVHTPTFFSLEDNYNSKMTTNFNNGDKFIQESPEGSFQYELNTPFRAVGSLAFIIMKRAIISADYEFVDYSNARFSAVDEDFIDENDAIRERYTATGNLRTGVEYKMGVFSLRGGYAFYGSPYKSTDENKDASYSTISGGFGFVEKNFYFDLTYVRSLSSDKHYLYDSYGNVNVKPVYMTYNDNKILMTFGIRF